MPDAYPRDMIGYGQDPPHADWPGGARIAIQLVLNYEVALRTPSCTAIRPPRPSSPT